MKKILDSVHGYIYVDDDYCTNIIDTEHFQRLRRIEQTSTRVIFPSARHDRFIHSLGVYYLGCKIVDRVAECLKNIPEDEQIKRKDVIFESYRIACLLHDVGHAPFSHRFEEFYSNTWSDLCGILRELVNDEVFSRDFIKSVDNSAPHEKMSAIVALGMYGDFIDSKKASRELIARMIIGLHYYEEKNNKLEYDDINHGLENIMITLIHGDVIDADGLDYVCRDAWASGYSTMNVDLERLIASIIINKNDKGKYQLCYTVKCLNEIEAVLKVKTFQQNFVITHHKVTYEQELLKKAIESAAVYHIFGEQNVTEDGKRQMALHQLCNVACLYNGKNLPCIELDFSKVKISLPMDDDFVALMKYIKDDKYVRQWLSRKYDLIPLWKSKADFYQRFESFRGFELNKYFWLFSKECKTFISDKFGIAKDDIWILSATPKYRENFAKKVDLFVNGEVLSYETLFPNDVHSYEPPKSEFYYIYVKSTLKKEEVINSLKEELQIRKQNNQLFVAHEAN